MGRRTIPEGQGDRLRCSTTEELAILAEQWGCSLQYLRHKRRLLLNAAGIPARSRKTGTRSALPQGQEKTRAGEYSRPDPEPRPVPRSRFARPSWFDEDLSRISTTRNGDLADVRILRGAS